MFFVNVYLVGISLCLNKIVFQNLWPKGKRKPKINIDKTGFQTIDGRAFPINIPIIKYST